MAATYQQQWTADMDAALREGVKNGDSYSVIADVVTGLSQRKISRSAAIGRAARLGIAIHRPYVRKPVPERRFRAPKPPKPVTFVKPPKFKPDAPPIPKHNDVARVSFINLEDHHCRWPVGEPGEPGFGFCGDAKVPGQSYCAGHCARAFNAPPPRVKQPPSRETERRQLIKILTDP